jgi:hypothetical protein
LMLDIDGCRYARTQAAHAVLKRCINEHLKHIGFASKDALAPLPTITVFPRE